MGRTIPRARLELLRADGNGQRVRYYEVELENVLIANIEQVVSEGNVLRDSVGLRFAAVKW